MQSDNLMKLSKEKLVDLLLTSIALLTEHNSKLSGVHPKDVLEHINRISNLVRACGYVRKELSKYGKEPDNE